MTIKLPANVVSFAAGDNDFIELCENYVDYWNQYRSEHGPKKFAFAEVDKEGKPITFAQKEERIGKLLLKEVSKRSGVDVTSMRPEAMASHPLVGWAVGNIATQLIDAVLPATIVEGTNAFCEVRTLGWGETGIFDIRSRDLFPVTRTGRMGMRTAELHKGFERQVTLNPEAHMITVYVSLFRVLAGQESLAVFTTKALRSIETEMGKDIYNAFANGMAALSTDATTGLQVTGYTQADLTKLANKVSAFSGGANAIVMGTKVALASVLPDDANTRAYYDSEYVKLGYVRTIAGIDTLEIPQVANWENPFATLISDTSLWVIAPGTDKIIKCVIGGTTMSNVDGQFDSANLTQTSTLTKFWSVGVITSSVAGLITL
jgi:hypothetical protein